jgi:hypothetical protein
VFTPYIFVGVGMTHGFVCCRYVIIENFIPPEEKTKLMNRAVYDEDEDAWALQPLAQKKSVLIFSSFLS